MEHILSLNCSKKESHNWISLKDLASRHLIIPLGTYVSAKSLLNTLHSYNTVFDPAKYWEAIYFLQVCYCYTCVQNRCPKTSLCMTWEWIFKIRYCDVISTFFNRFDKHVIWMFKTCNLNVFVVPWFFSLPSQINYSAC